MTVLIVVSLAAFGRDGEPTDGTANLLSLERMGAGAPAGWLVKGSDYIWAAEREDGPLGIGAARIQFGDDGHVEMVSPARFMPGGVLHGASLWARSEPPGAAVRLTLRGNDAEECIALTQSATAEESWKRMAVEEVLPETDRSLFYLTIAAEGKQCTLWLDGLWLGQRPASADAAWQPPIRPAGIVLTPRAPWGVVIDGEPLEVVARVVGVTQSGCRLQLRAVHTSGAVAALPSVALDAAGVWEGTFEVAGDVAKWFGMVRVEAAVVDAKGGVLSPMAETLLAHVPKPIPGPLRDSPFGVHVALREPDLDAVSRLGYKWCRIHDASAITKWGYVEPEPGKWVWADDAQALVRRHGLCTLGMLDGSPPWESGTQEEGYFSTYGAPRDVNHWRAYVREVVSHYAGAIDDWEVWNEPWDMKRFFHGGTPQLYVELLKAAYEEAKQANPACTVVGVDTCPAQWEQAVLAIGALPYCDAVSWHRYDPNLPGRPDDNIARVTSRLGSEQAKYGAPKPMLCSEGGPDVSTFHGSFFSFADPGISGDWSRGADLLVRMYVSCLAAGNERFFLYSVHNCARYGWPIHMSVEPGYLVRPMHAGVAALAQFLEGARYEKRLAPAHDVSAHVFSQPNQRFYADGPSTVAVLISNGEEPEDLPRALPSDIACFDRFANPVPVPVEAARSPVYLVARADASAAGLLEALTGEEEAPADHEPPIEPMLLTTVSSLTDGTPPLWTLFTVQGCVAAFADGSGDVMARRANLRRDGTVAARFRLQGVRPEDIRVVKRTIAQSRDVCLGWVELAAASAGGGPRKWVMTFSAVPDGPGRGWRYVTLCLLEAEESSEASNAAAQEALTGLHRFERVLVEGTAFQSRPYLHREPFCMAVYKTDGEAFYYTNPEHYMTMLNTALMWGSPDVSVLTPSNVAVLGDLAVVFGAWDLRSFIFGFDPFTFTATLCNTGRGWKLVSLAAGAGTRPTDDASLPDSGSQEKRAAGS